MVVSDLLPADVYALLLRTMPPPDGFEVAHRVKANFDAVRTTTDRRSARNIGFHNEIVGGLLTPTLLERFRPSLASAYRALLGER